MHLFYALVRKSSFSKAQGFIKPAPAQWTWVSLNNVGFRRTLSNHLSPLLTSTVHLLRLTVARKPARYCVPGVRIRVTSGSGVLASAVTMTTQQGSPSCPWVLTASPGQTIRLTLWDFAAPPTSTPAGGVTPCRRYAVVREAGARREVAVCQNEARERVVYTSTSDSVTLSITSKAPDVFFMFTYTGTLQLAVERSRAGTTRVGPSPLRVSPNSYARVFTDDNT